MTKVSSLLFAVAVLTCAGSALAVPEYPRQIQRDLSLSYEPPCRICHIHNTTGSGTIQTGFGVAMLARGLDGESRSSLDQALAQMKADKVDTDGDGISDVDEWRAGTDPNSPAPNAMLAGDDAPQQGCAFGGARSALSAWPLLAIVAFVLRRRRS